MSEDLRSSLRKIISETVGTKREITDSTRLFHDLNIKGDDVYWLFNELEKKYKTKFHGLDTNQYFSDFEEPIGIWIRRFFGYTADKKELTFGHLLNVVERGAWFDPPSAPVSASLRL
jgi:hypothetical protein